MIVSLDAAEGLVHKVATTAEETAQIDREAAVLDVARHPGVVQLRGRRAEYLEVGAISGWCLGDIGLLSPAEVAGVGCAIATVLADLHDLGVVHGSVEAGHVLLDGDGRPVLCSFGRGRLVGNGPGPVPADDVAALIDLLIALLPQGPETTASDGVRRALRSWGRPGRGPLGWRRPPTARRLAARLAAIPGAALPDPGVSRSPAPAAVVDDPAPRPRHGHRRWAVGAGAGAVVVATAAALIGFAWHGHPSPARCPMVDQGCRPVDHRDGVVVSGTRRFSLAGDSTDPLVLGRWTCGPALPALLRLDRGEVWVWDHWPVDGSAVAARLTGRVEDAATLRVVAGPSGCDRLSVVARGGAETMVP